MWARSIGPAVVDPPDLLTAHERRRLGENAFEVRLAAEQQFIGQSFVWTPSQAGAEAEVRRILTLARHNIRGAQQSLYGLGPSGTGKSTVMIKTAHTLHREYVSAVNIDDRGHPVVACEDGTADYVPVVWIDLMSDTRQRGVGHQMVTFFRRHVPVNESGPRTLSRAIDLAIQHGTRVVFFDECDNLATQRADRIVLDNMIKNLNTALGNHGIAFVYLGLPDAMGRGNLEDNPQLRNRLVPYRFSHMNFDLTAPVLGPDEYEWQNHLIEWEHVLSHVLPDLERGALASRLARLLWKRTKGSIVGLSALIKGATFTTLADRSPRNRLTITEKAVRDARLPIEFEAGGI